MGLRRLGSGWTGSTETGTSDENRLGWLEGYAQAEEVVVLLEPPDLFHHPEDGEEEPGAAPG